MMKYLRPAVMLLVLVIIVLAVGAPACAAERSPNFVVIFTDDQGYGDLSCFGK